MILISKETDFRSLSIRALLIIGLLLTGFGCASTGPVLSPEGTKTREILKIVQTMEEHVEARDPEKLAGHFAWDDPQAGEEFRSRVGGEFVRIDAIDLRMTVDRVVFEPGKITVALFWDGLWTLPDSPAPIPRNGNAVLTFSDTSPLRILQAAGELPWNLSPAP